MQVQRNVTQHNSAPGRYVRISLEEQVQRNATQQSNTKDILKLKPKCNATQHNSAMERYVRSALDEKYNATQHNRVILRTF